MGFNPVKRLNNMLKSSNLVLQLLAAFIVFGLFSLVLNFLNLTKEGLTAGASGGGHAMVYFYMDGCPHCDKFTPEWDKFAQSAKIKTQKIEAKKMTPEQRKLGIDGFPTVMLFGNGAPKKYQGARTANALNDFINNL